MLEHKHLLVIADLESPPRDERLIENWVSGLVVDMGMKKLIAPKAKYCDMKGNRGVTCICAIETSHIVFHSWDEETPGKLQLDVYSCALFSIHTVFDRLREFGAMNILYKFYDRNGGFSLLEENL